MSADFLDHSVYPDQDEPPSVLESMEDRADYLHRVCSAWDHGVHPDPETFALFSRWKDVLDRYPVSTSPAYHAFRAWFRWEPHPVPAGILAPTPRWVHLDRLEGRDADPCEEMI
ncbi:MAG: hypothetical protein NVSMB9_34740 [Isosphaeraceae bacterium]